MFAIRDFGGRRFITSFYHYNYYSCRNICTCMYVLVLFYLKTMSNLRKLKQIYFSWKEQLSEDSNDPIQYDLGICRAPMRLPYLPTCNLKALLRMEKLMNVLHVHVCRVHLHCTCTCTCTIHLNELQQQHTSNVITQYMFTLYMYSMCQLKIFLGDFTVFTLLHV